MPGVLGLINVTVRILTIVSQVQQRCYLKIGNLFYAIACNNLKIVYMEPIAFTDKNQFILKKLAKNLGGMDYVFIPQALSRGLWFFLVFI